jgi:hypothetical protein
MWTALETFGCRLRLRGLLSGLLLLAAPLVNTLLENRLSICVPSRDESVVVVARIQFHCRQEAEKSIV